MDLRSDLARRCWWPALLLLAGCALPTTSTPETPATSSPTPELRVVSGTAPRLAPPRLAPPQGSALSGRRHISWGSEPAEPPPLAPPEETRAVVLLYHAFDVGPDPLSVSSQSLDQQLTHLESLGIEVVPLSMLIEFLEGTRRLPARVAVITIDDGLRSAYASAWPILQKHHAPFALGISTGLTSAPRTHPLMSWSQIRELVDSGLCQVASHGHRHRRLVDLPADLAEAELLHSREVLEQETGQRPLAYFYPLGAVDDLAAERVSTAGYRAAFTATGQAIAYGSAQLTRIPRTSIFHDDSLGRFDWYFQPEFLGRLPLGLRAATAPDRTTQ